MKKIILFFCVLISVQVIDAMEREKKLGDHIPDEIIATLKPWKDSVFRQDKLVAFNFTPTENKYIYVKLHKRLHVDEYFVVTMVNKEKNVTIIKRAYAAQLRVLPPKPSSPAMKREKSMNFESFASFFKEK